MATNTKVIIGSEINNLLQLRGEEFQAGTWEYDVMTAAIDKIEALESPWISVDERLPEDTQAVLAWVPNNLCYYMVTLRPNGEWSSWQGDYRYWWCEFITHWMPLPTPPKGAE